MLSPVLPAAGLQEGSGSLHPASFRCRVSLGAQEMLLEPRDESPWRLLLGGRSKSIRRTSPDPLAPETARPRRGTEGNRNSLNPHLPGTAGDA